MKKTNQKSQANVKTLQYNSHQAKVASSQVTKLIRGLDNEAVRLEGATEAIAERLQRINAGLSEVNRMMGGITNYIHTASNKAPAEPKPVSKVATKKVVKPEPKAPAKAPTKKLETKKSEAKKSASKKTNDAKPAQVEKVPFREALAEVLKGNKSFTIPELEKIITEKFGTYSKPLYYNTLKNADLYTKHEDSAPAKYSLKHVKPSVNDQITDAVTQAASEQKSVESIISVLSNNKVIASVV